MSSFHPTRELPNGYALIGLLDLIEDRQLLLKISLSSLVLLPVSAMMFIWLLQDLRPDLPGISVQFSPDKLDLRSIFLPILVFFGVTLVMVMMHEALHGIFFWLFTGGKTRFGFKGAYAYAAAPDWFIPRKPYLIICLAPLVLISLSGMVALLFVPQSWILAIILLITMNVSGAAGDLYVFFWLLRQPADVLVQDFGERMKIYGPGLEIKPG